MKGELCNAVVVALGTTTRSGIMEWSQKDPPQISYQLSNECIWGKNYRNPVHRYKSLDFIVFVVSALIIGIDFFTQSALSGALALTLQTAFATDS